MNFNKDWVGNKNSIFATIGASNHTEKQRDVFDLYCTDPIAIDKLVAAHHPLPCNVWEPSAGFGHLSERLLHYGINVTSTDLIDRGYGKGGVDFLETTTLPDVNIDCILTNPPYKHATQFILHALELLQDKGQCIMLLKTTFLEGKKRKAEIFKPYPPKVIYQFSERLLCAKNGEFERMRQGGGSAVAYAWYIWEKGYKGDTIVKWI